MGHVAVRHAIRIEATAQAVWKVLADFQRYPEWNPMLVRVRARAEEGAGISFTVRLANGWKLPLWGKVSRSRTDGELRWRVGVPGVFHGEHYITIERDGNGCKVVHGEDFRGLLCSPLRGLLESLGGPMYARMNEALKLRVEQGASGAEGTDARAG
jgi:hypothetical protein